MLQETKQIPPQVLQDRILITRNKPETVSAGGIILPEASIEEENRGIVVAVGPAVGKNTPKGKPFPKVGDMVIFGEHAGVEIEPYNDGVEYTVLRELDVVAIL